MKPEDKQHVRDSWAKVVPIQETAAELFYRRLFDQNPEVKPLFKGDMKEQGAKLMKMIDLAVGSLDNLDALVAPLKAAGLAHKGYGVAEEDYAKVGAALLWTLEQGLGEAYTEEVKTAWTSTYTTLSSVMIDGAGYGSSTTVIEAPWWKKMLGVAPA